MTLNRSLTTATMSGPAGMAGGALRAGGPPIFHGGGAVGPLGVPGAQEAEDIACAKAAPAALGLAWEP